MTSSASRALGTARPVRHQAGSAATTAVVLPDPSPEAARTWARLITGVNGSGKGAFALDGPSLTPGSAYEVPVDALIVWCEVSARTAAQERAGRRAERQVRLLRVQVAELAEVKTWELKAPLGKRVTDYAAKRLAAGAARHQATLLDTRPNKWPGWCARCHQQVPAGVGNVLRLGDRYRVIHEGPCPPAPAPPEIIDPNAYPGICFACGGWVSAGQGVAVLRTSPSEIIGGRYHACHKGQCPPDAPPGPPNQVEDWCADCGEPAGAGEGYWLDQELHHTGECPPSSVEGPTWVLCGAGARGVEPGEVLRARLDLRHGGDPVPDGAPGRRVLDGDDFVELIAVVVQVVARRGGRRKARVRVATAAEAADVLAEQVVLVPDTRPAAAGFKARWGSEQIGPNKPWLAELTGRDPDYGFRRDFLRADRDYTDANSKGTRGVWFWWTLTINRVYEAQAWHTWSRGERVFLRATPEGDVVEIDRAEAEAWLDNPPVWPAT